MTPLLLLALGINSMRSLSDSSEKGTISRASRKVAIVGSSGGGAAALGQFDALSLLSLARSELGEAGIEVAAVQFVACSKPLDSAPPNTAAALWVLKGDQEFAVSAEGTLQEVNEAARAEDVKIAAALSRKSQCAEVLSGGHKCGIIAPQLHGLVAISCDVQDINSKTFAAALSHQRPIVGTGGSSLGEAIAMGCWVVGSSGGSVATTNKIKAVSYAAGLASHWGLKYSATKALTVPLVPSAMFGGCLPSFLGIMLIGELILLPEKFLGHPMWEWIVFIRASLPVVAGAMAARQASTMTDIATAAGIIAGSLCQDSTAAALVAGTFAGYSSSIFAAGGLWLGMPATALAMSATATSGLLCGILVRTLVPIIEALEAMTVSTDELLNRLPHVSAKASIGAALGCLMCYGSKVGWYHRLFLPLIVLELAGRRASLWGAIDLCSLCMVAAGLCAAHWLRPSSKADVPLAARGTKMNLCYGDFIEVAYPFMERCRWCNAGAYLGSALSGAIIAINGTSSSAYLPLPLVIFIAQDRLSLCLATASAFLGAFLLAVVRPVRHGSVSQ